MSMQLKRRIKKDADAEPIKSSLPQPWLQFIS